MKECAGEFNVCLLFGCSECCNPVKVHSKIPINPREAGLPFIEMEGLLVPESNPDTIRLKQFLCINFNAATGLCGDYANRPSICRNTKCRAFEAIEYKDKEKIVSMIKKEQFFKINTGGKNVELSKVANGKIHHAQGI